MYSNVDGFLNKRSELQLLISVCKPKIICLTEILPKCLTNIDIEIEFYIPGYDMFFNDPGNRGVAIYIDESLGAQRYIFSNVVEESVWCVFEYICLKCLIGNVYRNHDNKKIDFVGSLRNLFT